METTIDRDLKREQVANDVEEVVRDLARLVYGRSVTPALYTRVTQGYGTGEYATMEEISIYFGSFMAAKKELGVTPTQLAEEQRDNSE